MKQEGRKIIVSDIWASISSQLTREERKGNVLFNDALNTFYLQLYGVGQTGDHTWMELVYVQVP